MSIEQKLLSDFKKQIEQEETSLQKMKKEILAFSYEKHNSKETKERFKSLKIKEGELDRLREDIFKLKILPEFEKPAEGLYKECDKLYGYVQRIDKILSDDLTECLHNEDKKSSDLIRNVGIYFGIVAAFVASVKAGVGNGTVSPDLAAGAGGTTGVIVLAHKEIWTAFKAAGRAICATPRRILKHFSHKEKILREKSIYKRAAGAINVGISRSAFKINKAATKYLQRKNEL